MFTFLSFNMLRLCEINSPALEKSLSEGTDEAGIERNFFARTESCGNSADFFFHHESGSSHRVSRGSSKYRRSSM